MPEPIEDNQRQRSFVRCEERLPDRNIRVIVVCRDCRCLGYLDNQGVWRRHYGGQPLEGVIGWMP